MTLTQPAVDPDYATLRQFMRETPDGATDLARARRSARHLFDTDQAFNHWRRTWLPYIAELADGPVDPDTYAALLPDLSRWWAAR
jgi:hypothetical protein